MYATCVVPTIWLPRGESGVSVLSVYCRALAMSSMFMLSTALIERGTLGLSNTLSGKPNGKT